MGDTALVLRETELVLPPRIEMKKQTARETSLGDGIEEPLVNEFEASTYLGFQPITVLRMAHRGTIPSIAFPIGSTGKCRHKFRISELKAYTESISRSA